MLRIVKKGDYKIRDFDCADGYIAYSDAVDTQVFKFDPESLMLKKVSTQICHDNSLERLPPA